MNKKNTIYWMEDGYLHIDRMLRDRNDPDDDGTPIFRAKTPATGLDDDQAMKRLETIVVRQYDEWIRETRG